MKLSYLNGFDNKGNTFIAQDISTDSLPHQANTNNIHQYLTPDYFLLAVIARAITARSIAVALIFPIINHLSRVLSK